MSSNLKNYTDFIESKILEAKQFSKEGKMGMVRSTMKDSVELLLDLIWKNERGGESKKNDFIPSTSKSGITLNFQVDRHLYNKEKKLEKIGECKAYLDRCFMERASSDFRRIVNGSPSKPKTFILALENCVSDKSFKYYMDEDSIDRVFFLMDGKRNAKKPIWKDGFEKKINQKSLQEFIDYINKI